MNHVHLTIDFELDADLQVSHLSSLRELWRDRYPRTAERAPRPRSESDAVRFMSRDTSWPFPYLSFNSADREIIIEASRFGLTWTFGDGAAAYPGFEALRVELAERFNEFRSAVEREVEKPIRITGAQCQYFNTFVDESLSRVIAHVLTDGAVDLGPETDRDDVDYQGFRRHIEGSATNGMVDVLVGVDVGAHDRREVELFLDATHRVGDEQHELGGIDLAHDALINTFETCTRPDQHEGWGRVGTN